MMHELPTQLLQVFDRLAEIGRARHAVPAKKQTRRGNGGQKRVDKP